MHCSALIAVPCIKGSRNQQTHVISWSKRTLNGAREIITIRNMKPHSRKMMLAQNAELGWGPGSWHRPCSRGRETSVSKLNCGRWKGSLWPRRALRRWVKEPTETGKGKRNGGSGPAQLCTLRGKDNLFVLRFSVRGYIQLQLQLSTAKALLTGKHLLAEMAADYISARINTDDILVL